MPILDAAGRPIPSPDEAKAREIVAAELKAFGEWQAMLNDGKGLTTHGLDAIARSCIASLYRSLPIGMDGAYLNTCLSLLEIEITRISEAKAAEAKIAKAMQATDGPPH